MFPSVILNLRKESPTLVTSVLEGFVYFLFYFVNWHIVDLQYHVSFRCISQ